MADGSLWCELSAPDVPPLVIGDPSDEGTGSLRLTSDGIAGWWSAPAAKTSLTEMQADDGAHAVGDALVLYSSRTVTLTFAALGDRSQLLAARDRIGMFMGRARVRLTVHEGSDARYVTGYVTPAWSDVWTRGADTCTLTVVCPDPLKYSVDVSQGELEPGGAYSGGGLPYPAAYPVDYRETLAAGATMRATLRNRGNHRAYPRLLFSLPNGSGGSVGVRWSSGDGSTGLVSCRPPAHGSQPIDVDTRRGTATYGGLDVTSGFESRQWPSIPPGSTLSLVYEGAAGGAVGWQTQDTYI
jgi:hypothetical protein